MEQKQHRWKLARAVVAIVVGLLLLGIGLPGTGYVVTDHPPPPSMWRIAMFAIYPASFFILIGIVTIPLACVLFGLMQRSALEIVGWSLLGLIVILTLFMG